MLNESERFVAELATKSFLSLWSLPNPEGPRRKGRVKELCDLAVVFGPHVLLFSVKEKELADPTSDVGVKRWEKKAVEDSVRQLQGAERMLHKLDSLANSRRKQALALPSAEERVVHRIAVALGAEGKLDSFAPYRATKYGPVHVWNALDVARILGELDTISDFVHYLSRKEELLLSARVVMHGGEEDLLAMYLSNNRAFTTGEEAPRLIVIEEGIWAAMVESPEVVAKREADRESYFWDHVIETISRHQLNETLLGPAQYEGVELSLRQLAGENRFARRALGSSLLNFIDAAASGRSRARICSPLLEEDIPYVFLGYERTGAKPRDLEELAQRCEVAWAMFPEARGAIGIGTEAAPMGSPRSYGLVYYTPEPNWSGKERANHAKLLLDELPWFAAQRTQIAEVSYREYPRTSDME